MIAIRAVSQAGQNKVLEKNKNYYHNTNDWLSSRGGLGGKATTMFKHSCHFSPGGSNPAWGDYTRYMHVL